MRDGARAPASTDPRRADADAAQLRGLDRRPPCAASCSAAAIALATSAGPPLVGVGCRALPEHVVRGVGDDRLDLRPAEVDPADELGARSALGSALGCPGCSDTPFRLLPAGS